MSTPRLAIEVVSPTAVERDAPHHLVEFVEVVSLTGVGRDAPHHLVEISEAVSLTSVCRDQRHHAARRGQLSQWERLRS